MKFFADDHPVKVSTKQLNLDDAEIEESKRDLITREIGKFREVMKVGFQKLFIYYSKIFFYFTSSFHNFFSLIEYFFFNFQSFLYKKLKLVLNCIFSKT